VQSRQGFSGQEMGLWLRSPSQKALNYELAAPMSLQVGLQARRDHTVNCKFW
jgi:hypothetical protein